MKNHLIFLFSSAVFILGTVISFAQTVHTGIYNWGTLCLVADNASGKVTGYYENYSGLNQMTEEFKYSCVFFFSSTMVNGQKDFPVLSYLYDGSDTISGEIKIESDSRIRIYLNREHGSCSHVEKFSEKISPVFQLTEEKIWRGMTAVKSEKAFFYNSPDETKKSNKYAVKGDCMKILEEKDQWIKVEFLRGDHIVFAWLKKTDLF